MPTAPGVLFQPQPTSRIFFEVRPVASPDSTAQILLSQIDQPKTLSADRFGLRFARRDALARYAFQHFREAGKIESVKGHLKLSLQVFESHAIEHDRLIALQSNARHNHKIATHLPARRRKIAAGQQARHADIAAKVIVLDCSDVQTRSKASIQSLNLATQHWREQCSDQDRSAEFGWRSPQRFAYRPRSSFEPALERAKFIFEAAHHADAVFDLWILSVMPATRNRTAGAQINFITQKGERGSQRGAQIALN